VSPTKTTEPIETLFGGWLMCVQGTMGVASDESIHICEGWQVSDLDTRVSCAKTDELIETLFGDDLCGSKEQCVRCGSRSDDLMICEPGLDLGFLWP